MSAKIFKILSIDGGGIKGLYSAKILQKIELNFQQKHEDENLRIVDCFDLVCGTSTGGIIALAISLKIPMVGVCGFYEKHGANIFSSPRSIYRKFRQVLFRGKYSDNPLKKAGAELFGEHKLQDSHCLLCIPSYDFTHGTFALFKYDHKEGNLNRHNKLSYLDVALSTSAAPTYFPLAQIEEENNTQYLDGGVWANNPSLVGFTEGIRYFVGDDKAYDNMQILSVSSLNIKKGQAPMIRRQRSFLDWTNDLFDLSLIGQSEFSDIFLSTIIGKTKFPLEYLRIPSANIAGEQATFISLDNASPESLNLMKQYADHMYHSTKNNEIMKKIIASKKTYRVK